MAKSKQKKTPPKGVLKVKPRVKPKAAKAPKKSTRAKLPKQQPLIKGARIKALDNVCHALAEVSASMNRSRGEEADLKRQAGRLLHQHKRTSWTFSGKQVMLAPGEEKVLVRNVKDESASTQPSDADAVDVSPGSTGAEETVDEQGDRFDRETDEEEADADR